MKYAARNPDSQVNHGRTCVPNPKRHRGDSTKKRHTPGVALAHVNVSLGKDAIFEDGWHGRRLSTFSDLKVILRAHRCRVYVNCGAEIEVWD